jgi:hypothetical protein
MTTISIDIDEETLEVLKVRAKLEAVTLDQLFSSLVASQLEEIRTAISDPVIGLFESGVGDLSERDEEYMTGRPVD